MRVQLTLIMSSIRMEADSTLLELRDDRGSKKRKKARDVPRHRTKKMKKGSSRTAKENKKKRAEDDSECESDLDLDKPLMAIGDYIKSREEMVEHMFRSISQVKLRGMLPDILKPLPPDELKMLSVNHLEMMSKKRIRRILDGDDPDAISSSGTEESTESEEEEGTHRHPVDGIRTAPLPPPPPQQSGTGPIALLQDGEDQLAGVEGVSAVRSDPDEAYNQQQSLEVTAEEVAEASDADDDVDDEDDYQERCTSPYTSPHQSAHSHDSYSDYSSSNSPTSGEDSDMETVTESEAGPESEPEEGELVEEKPRKKRRRRKKFPEVMVHESQPAGTKENQELTKTDGPVVGSGVTVSDDVVSPTNMSVMQSSGEMLKIRTNTDTVSKTNVENEPSGEASDAILTEPPGDFRKTISTDVSVEDGHNLNTESAGDMQQEASPEMDVVLSSPVHVEPSDDTSDNALPKLTENSYTEPPCETPKDGKGEPPNESVDDSHVEPPEDISNEMNTDASECADAISPGKATRTVKADMHVTSVDVDSVLSDESTGAIKAEVPDASQCVDIAPPVEMEDRKTVSSGETDQDIKTETKRYVKKTVVSNVVIPDSPVESSIHTTRPSNDQDVCSDRDVITGTNEAADLRTETYTADNILTTTEHGEGAAINKVTEPAIDNCAVAETRSATQRDTPSDVKASTSKHCEVKKRDTSKTRHVDAKRRRSSNGDGKVTSEASIPTSHVLAAEGEKIVDHTENQHEAKSEKRKSNVNVEVSTKKRRSGQNFSRTEEDVRRKTIDISLPKPGFELRTLSKVDTEDSKTKHITIAEHVAAAVKKERSESRRQSKKSDKSAKKSSTASVENFTLVAKAESQSEETQIKEQHAHIARMIRTDETGKHDHRGHIHVKTDRGERQITLTDKKVSPNKHKMIMDDFKCTVTVPGIQTKSHSSVASHKSHHRTTSKGSHKTPDSSTEASQADDSREKKKTLHDPNNSQTSTHHSHQSTSRHKHQTHRTRDASGAKELQSTTVTIKEISGDEDHKSHKLSVSRQPSNEEKHHKSAPVRQSSVEKEHTSKTSMLDKKTSSDKEHTSQKSMSDRMFSDQEHKKSVSDKEDKSHKSVSVKKTIDAKPRSEMADKVMSTSAVPKGEVSKRTITISPGPHPSKKSEEQKSSAKLTSSGGSSTKGSSKSSTNATGSITAGAKAGETSIKAKSRGASSVEKAARSSDTTSTGEKIKVNTKVNVRSTTSSKLVDSKKNETVKVATTCESTKSVVSTSAQSSTGTSFAKTSHGEESRRVIKISRKPVVVAAVAIDTSTKGEPDAAKVDTSQISSVSSEAAKVKSSLSNTQREILELEMRARAIKAMLKSQEMKEVKRIQSGAQPVHKAPPKAKQT